MFTYNFYQWLLLFYIYCFLGWCVESTIVSTRERRFINRGFLKGPLLPIYGTGTILILFVSLPLIENPLLVYLSGAIATTILEYFTGWLMESLFKIKYWDYSEDKFNYKGRICLVSSLFWGVLTLFVLYVIHSPISTFVTNLNYSTLIILTALASIIFLVDLIYSTYNVIDLNKILGFMTKIRKEMEALTAQIKDKTPSLPSTDLASIKNKLTYLKGEYEKYSSKVNFFHKQIIKAYPSASSKKFNEAFKFLKEKIENTFYKRK